VEKKNPSRLVGKNLIEIGEGQGGRAMGILLLLLLILY
jgi:hypothetical protein